MNPERMVIQGSPPMPTHTCKMYGFNVDSVVVNRVMPETASVIVFSRTISLRKKIFGRNRRILLTLTDAESAARRKEVFGLDLLHHIGESLTERNPLDFNIKKSLLNSCKTAKITCSRQIAFHE